ncbi:hypothetical protein I6R01_003836 [Salmonella enterica subsp. enterica serovar Cerro]|nr:hypothetical protein [Salmonella enterica subsp. enterica serovar Cerro]
MDGFAQGLLAGFNTVDNAMQQRKAMGLREAALAQQQKNADREYQMAQDEFGYKKELDARDDDFRKKEFGLKQLDTQARLGMERQQLAMQKETHDFKMNNAKYLQTMQQWEPDNRVVESLLAQGKVQEAAEYTKSRNMPTTIPVVRMLRDNEYAQSVFNAGKNLYSIMSAPDVHKNPMSVMDAINDNPDEYAPLLQPEADRAIGLVDPDTGKTIIDSRFNHLAPLPDAKDPNRYSATHVAVFNRVKYDDGSEAVKPVTGGRSADKNDHILPVDIGRVLGSSSARVEGAHKIINYNDAIASAYQPQGLSLIEQQKLAAKAAVAAAGKDGGDPQVTYDSMMGAFGNKEYQQKAQQTQAAKAAKAWAGDDKSKLAFVQGVLAEMPELFSPGNEKQLEIYFQNFTNENTNTQEKLKDTSASGWADQLRYQREQQQKNNDFLYGSD